MAPDDSTGFEQRFQQMLEKLRALDFRITHQRLAVIRVLAASDEHPSAEQIFEKVRSRFPTTSLATVYKTIALLKDLGEVLELGFPDGSNRYDGNRPYPHPHIVCTGCGKIVDPEVVSLDEFENEIVRKTGFRILYHRLDFFGLCQECQKFA